MLVGSKFTVSDIDKPILAFLLMLSPLEADAMVADYLFVVYESYYDYYLLSSLDLGSG